MAAKIRKGDKVVVLTGRDKGRTGEVIEVRTTEPGVQFYSGNMLDGIATAYGANAGFCLETQHFPDSPNRPEFPSTIVRPGHPYRSRTMFMFSTDRS